MEYFITHIQENYNKAACHGGMWYYFSALPGGVGTSAHYLA
jgi:hypothetical protein